MKNNWLTRITLIILDLDFKLMSKQANLKSKIYF
jgi:hypothetical protein